MIYAITFLIFNFAILYLSSKILDKKLNYCDYRLWLFSLILCVMRFCLQEYQSSFIVLYLGIIWMEAKVLWNCSMNVTGIAVAFSYLSHMYSEVIIALILSIFVDNWNELNLAWNLGLNITISLLAIVLFHVLSLSKVYQKIIEYLGTRNKMTYIIIGFIVLNFTQFQLHQKKISIMSLFFIIVLFIIVMEYVKEKIKKEKIVSEYETLLQMTEQFENVLMEKNQIRQEI